MMSYSICGHKNIFFFLFFAIFCSGILISHFIRLCELSNNNNNNNNIVNKARTKKCDFRLIKMQLNVKWYSC